MCVVSLQEIFCPTTVCADAVVSIWQSEDNLCGSVFFPYYRSSIRPGGKYPPSEPSHWYAIFKFGTQL
ncbi:mCG1045492 [Mus musculus]|nr:mCG1045492 [Mus musculus]